MVIRKSKKVRKFRGKRNYGYGSHKKHRGGGSRGGRGNAGKHKHKWSHTVKYEPDNFGKRGFKRPQRYAKPLKTINVSQIGRMAEGKKVDLIKLGYGKVLGNGTIGMALEVTARAFSKKAVEKIEAAGGRAVMPGVEEVERSDED